MFVMVCWCACACVNVCVCVCARASVLINLAHVALQFLPKSNVSFKMIRDLRKIDYNASQCINATAKHPVCFAIRCRCCGLHHFNFPQALSQPGEGMSIISLNFRFVLQTIKAKTK